MGPWALLQISAILYFAGGGPLLSSTFLFWFFASLVIACFKKSTVFSCVKYGPMGKGKKKVFFFCNADGGGWSRKIFYENQNLLQFFFTKLLSCRCSFFVRKYAYTELARFLSKNKKHLKGVNLCWLEDVLRSADDILLPLQLLLLPCDFILLHLVSVFSFEQILKCLLFCHFNEKKKTMEAMALVRTSFPAKIFSPNFKNIWIVVSVLFCFFFLAC